MTFSMIQKIITYLNTDACPIVNAFFDWNPIMDDEFRPGGEVKLWEKKDDEVSPWATLVQSAKKLQVLFIRASNLQDSDLAEMAPLLKSNSTIKVLDISSN